MKKQNILIALCMILMMSLVVAEPIYFPLPVDGKITGPNIAGLEIKVTNQRTGKVMTTVSNEAGEYLLDWANSDGDVQKYADGDVFEIQVISCANNFAACKKVVTYSGQSEIYVEFDLSSTIVTCPPVKKCSSCHCDDNPVSSCPEDTTPYSSCSSCCPASEPSQECDICPPVQKCPDDTTPYGSCDSCCTEKICPVSNMPLTFVLFIVGGVLGLVIGYAVPKPPTAKVTKAKKVRR